MQAVFLGHQGVDVHAVCLQNKLSQMTVEENGLSLLYGLSTTDNRSLFTYVHHFICLIQWSESCLIWLLLFYSNCGLQATTLCGSQSHSTNASQGIVWVSELNQKTEEIPRPEAAVAEEAVCQFVSGRYHFLNVWILWKH